MDKEIVRIRNIIIESFGRAVGVYGLNETIGRIYGYLFFCDEAVGLEKIADDLEVSKATVSINIRILLEFKMVKKIWKRGSRKDYYEAERDFIKIMQETLKNKEREQVEMLKGAVKEARYKYKKIVDKIDSGGELIKNDLEKIELLEEWVHKSEKWINFMLKITAKEKEEETELKKIDVEWGGSS